jgi:hypothetical protein
MMRLPFRPLELLLLAILVVITAAGFVLIPAGLDLPVHWGLDGSVTATMTRNWALLQMPIAAAIIWGLFYLIATSGRTERRRGTAIVLRWGPAVLTAVFILAQLLIVLSGLGVAVPFFHAS